MIGILKSTDEETSKLPIVFLSRGLMRKLLILYPILIYSIILFLGFTFDRTFLFRNWVTTSITTRNLQSGAEPSQGDIYYRALLNQVDRDRALIDLQRLTGEEQICLDQGCYSITNRFTGSEGLQWAKDYVYTELTDLGYSVEVHNWYSNGYADQNLIARKPGLVSPGEEIYFIAHLDGVGSDGGRYPAADDNASGVVDLLELARVLSSFSFNRTVVLLFSTGEELGTLGVQSYLDAHTPEELSAIIYAINIDMIGYDANRDQVMELWHDNHPQSLVLTEMIREIIQTSQLNLTPMLAIGCG